MDHRAAGQLEPVEVVTVDHLGYLPQTKDIPVPLQRGILVLDVIRDVVDVFESNVVWQHKVSSKMFKVPRACPIIPGSSALGQPENYMPYDRLQRLESPSSY